jgi:hypothetical protein
MTDDTASGRARRAGLRIHQAGAGPATLRATSAAGIAEEIAGWQGWTDTKLLAAVLDYVENQGSDEAFADYLLGRAGDGEGLTRLFLSGYEGIGPFPAACQVCGDDVDIHLWWDIADGGRMVTCDRSAEQGTPVPQRTVHAKLVVTLERQP